ncbi:4'-phosphopantetheinyl transferase superfamily protein [Desulfovibrio sp. OttesenSCG-928-G15]|nr:4'-phosphopantetheinyl transferase superfamily protein [Desulfovibrio sp. OttesenSCG-928-G15]
MMLAQDFSEFSFPALPENVLLCIGLRLEDAGAWCRECGFFTTDSEKAHARSFVHVMDAARHLAGRALVRRVLELTEPAGAGAGADFARNAWGKPVCPESGADFSISHSGVMVWAAFCRGAFVGIDVEEILPLPDLPGLAGQLHPKERDAILAQPPDKRERDFYRCWTRKEALLKATGMGLSRPLNSFQVSTDQRDHNWVHVPPERDASAWTSADISFDAGYSCSVAATAPHLELAVHVL